MKPTTSKMITGSFYGFRSTYPSEKSAWFHTRDAAHLYAKASRWDDYDIDEADEVDEEDIMDTPEQAGDRTELEITARLVGLPAETPGRANI